MGQGDRMAAARQPINIDFPSRGSINAQSGFNEQGKPLASGTSQDLLRPVAVHDSQITALGNAQVQANRGYQTNGRRLEGVEYSMASVVGMPPGFWEDPDVLNELVGVLNSMKPGDVAGALRQATDILKAGLAPETEERATPAP